MKLKFYIFILHIFFFKNIQIKCENDITKVNEDNIKQEQKEILLKDGYIQEVSITSQNPKNISVNFGEKKINKLLIHIFSINCQIHVIANLSNIVNKIDNYDNNAYLVKIDQSPIRIQNIQIQLSLNQNNDDSNKTCPIIINSMHISNKGYNLTIEENNPTIFLFNNTVQNINLKYELQNNSNEFNDDSYVVFSFIFNEKALFEINIEEDIEFNQIRNISNSHNIFLTKKSFVGNIPYYLNINIRRIGEDNSPVLLTFRAISNKQIIPLILQKNYLNQGFITSNIKNQYYYMEIMKGEEGEIMLHDKRQNGELIGRICNKKNKKGCNIKDYNLFIENDNKKLQYKEHFRKLEFSYKDTQECDEGCYLLISYNHEMFPKINNTIIGFEFTLLARIWNKEDWSQTNIVNIPNNEYIFGYFEKNLINQHYYSILVHNETELIVEIKGQNFNFFYGEGLRKLNTYNELLDSLNELEIENEMEMKIIPYQRNGDKYLSFAIRPKNFFEDVGSFYYFRFFQTENISHLIMPIDSNIENNCKQLNSINYANLFCIYLLKNDYNEFYLNFSIAHSSIFHNHLSLQYIYKSPKKKSLDFKEETSFDFSIEDKEGSIEQNAINNIDDIDLNYILLIFYLPYQKSESYLSFFNDNNKDIYPQIYSNQIYKINSKSSFVFSSLVNYYLNLKWINGIGDIQKFKSIDFTIDKNDKGKIYSTLIPNNEELKITFNNVNELFLNLGLKYTIKNDVVRKIKDGEIYYEMIQDTYFPIYFYYKLDSENAQYDINFRIINYNNSFTKYSIDGMFCDEKTIKRVEKSEYISFQVDLEAQYDSCLDIGLLEIPENKIEENDEYLLIKINQLNETLNANVLIQTLSLAKYLDFFYTFFPINQYILGSTYNNNEDSISEYILIDILHENNTQEKMVVEFSTNNPGIELYFDNEDAYEKICSEGIEKYLVTNLNDENFFRIKYNDEKAIKDLSNSKYLIRYYYLTDRFINVNYNFSKKYLIEDKIVLNKTFTSILFQFENLKIYYNNINNKKEINDTIDYIIYLNLFLKENIKESLNSTALISTKPVANEVVTSSNKEQNFSVNMTINKTKVSNFNYIMQIKFYLSNSKVNDEMLAYSIEMNLSKALKSQEKNKPDDDNDNDKALITILAPIMSVLGILFIFIVIYIYKMKKKNKELKDKVLSISFAEGKSDNILTADNMHSKKDEEYESTFI